MKKKKWDCWSSCKSSKKWKGKISRDMEEQWKEKYCEMKGRKVKGIEEEKDNEHEKEKWKDKGKGADKKWKGGRKKGRSGRKRSYIYCIKIVQLQSEINHDMKEFFLARLECHINLGNVQANKSRKGDCGSAPFCIHNLVLKTSKKLILIINHIWINLWNLSLYFIKHTKKTTNPMSQPLMDPRYFFCVWIFLCIYVFCFLQAFCNFCPNLSKNKTKEDNGGPWVVGA